VRCSVVRAIRQLSSKTVHWVHLVGIIILDDSHHR
jgi:hypothetical protein